MDQEQIIEKLIKTKNLPEALVIITDNSVNVTVSTQELLRSDVAKIDIVMRETGRDAGQIVVQNKKRIFCLQQNRRCLEAAYELQNTSF